MRIGLISPPWLPVPPPGYGGTEAVVDCLARGLVAAGHDVLLVAPGDSGCPVPQVNPIPVAATAQMGESEVELGYVVRAYAGLCGVEVVHDHTLAGPLYAGRPPHLPVVATNHGSFSGCYADIYRAAAERAHVVAISTHHASTARGIRITRVIRHGIDVDDVPVGEGDGGYVVFLGRMSPDKGVREALVAARQAGVRLVLAGRLRPVEQEYFAQEVEPLLGPAAEFIGEVDSVRRNELLGAATALLNPLQWEEPFGLVMIESLACGTPVVATPMGAVPEIVDDGVTGFIRTGQDGLASALHRVAALDRKACRRAAEERFSTERMVAEHLRLYQEVSARGSLLSR
jgi:glycosyltransferase involved in cell wall biosynthesis